MRFLDGALLAGENNYYLTIKTTGMYSVDGKNAKRSVTMRTISLTSSNTAAIDSVEMDILVNNNSSLVYVNGNYKYCIDVQNYQNKNFFVNQLPGIYTVYVNDDIDYGFTTQEISV